MFPLLLTGASGRATALSHHASQANTPKPNSQHVQSTTPAVSLQVDSARCGEVISRRIIRPLLRRTFSRAVVVALLNRSAGYPRQRRRLGLLPGRPQAPKYLDFDAFSTSAMQPPWPLASRRQSLMLLRQVSIAAFSAAPWLAAPSAMLMCPVESEMAIAIPLLSACATAVGANATRRRSPPPMLVWSWPSRLYSRAARLWRR